MSWESTEMYKKAKKEKEVGFFFFFTTNKATDMKLAFSHHAVSAGIRVGGSFPARPSV